MSGNAMSYGGGPIQQLYDSSGPDGKKGSPHALCGFVFGSGEAEPPMDAVLRPQVSASWASLVSDGAGRCSRRSVWHSRGGRPTPYTMSGERAILGSRGAKL